MRKLTISTLLILLFTSCKVTQSQAQTFFARQQVLTGIPVSGYNSPTITALLWLPPDYNAANTYPLIISMGGNGQTSIQAELTVHGCAYFISQGWNANAVNPNTGLTEEFIIFTPVNNGPNQWFKAAPVKSMLNYLEANYSINTSKVFITGLSAGGFATISSVTFDNSLIPRFAAAAPISPVGDFPNFDTTLYKTVTYNVPLWFAGGLAGDAQYSTAVNYSKIVNALNPPIPALLQGVVGGGHNNATWDTVYNPLKKFQGYTLYEWFLKNSRGAVTANTITTGTITPNGSSCVTTVSGANISVAFSTTGTFNAGNTFTLQRSDASGNFGSPVNIGTASSSPISGVVPANTPTSTTYKFRVISNNPATVGSASANRAINLAANSIAPTATQNISISVNGTQLNGTEQSTATSRNWLSNGSPIAGQTATSYLPFFVTAGAYNISLNSVFSCNGTPTTITSNSVLINASNIQSSKVYVTKNSGCGVYRWSSGNPGDTIVIPANLNPYCFINFYNLHGTPSKHITIIAEGGAVLCTGSLSLINCTFIDVNFGTQTGLPTVNDVIDGVAVSMPYGYESDGGDTLGGYGFELRGKDSNITFSNIYIHDRGILGTQISGYGIAMKNDPADYGCDSSYDYPNGIKHIKGWNVLEKNLSQDGNYLASQFGYNTNQQGVVCGGITHYFRPTSVNDIELYNFYMKNIGRSAFQLSQVLDGGKFHDMLYENIGYEVSTAQGAFAACGTVDSSLEFYNITGKLTFKPAFYFFGYGTAYIHDCNVDSSGWAYDTNHVLQSQGVSNIEFYPQNNTYHTPINFIIRNNILGAHKNPAGNIAFFTGATNNYATTGNVICGNVGQVIYTGNTNVQYTLCPPVNTITINSITPSSFCVTPTVGANVTINFTPVGTYGVNNLFTAQLSNATGNFSSAINIGSVLSGTSISAIIPANIQYGTGYQIRIVSANPIVTSNSTNPFTIILSDNSITPTATQNIFTNVAGNTLTVSEPSTPTSRQWVKNGSPIAGQTGLTYTPIFTTAGTYTITCQSIFPCLTKVSNAVTIIVSDPPPPPPDSVFTGTITGSPFCVGLTGSANVNVPYTSNRTSFNAGNVFTVQLSDANGSFASATTIGTSTSTAASGTIACVIPAGTPTGAGYRIRIRSGNPSATTVRNNSPLTINLAANSIAPASIQNIYTNTAGQTLTVSELSLPVSRAWLYGTISGIHPTNTGNTSTSYTPNFATAGSYFVVAVSNFACESDTSNEVLINVSVAPPPPPDTTFDTIQIQHDTTYADTQKIVTPRDSVVTDTTFDSLTYVHLNKVQYRVPKHTVKTKITTYTLYDTTFRYFDTTTITPLHDTIILTISNHTPNLYGFNENNFPDYQNAAFVDSIRAIGVNIMRYPGGGISDSSNWQTQQKPTLPLLASMRSTVGCDIDFVLNMNTSSLGYQMQMLDSAYKLGIPIKYVEMGNEVNNTDSPLRAKFHNSGAEYGDTCRVWAAAIKVKYPDCKIGVWGENKTDSPTWHSDLLSAYTPDAMITHLYPNEYQIADTVTGIIDTALFAHILNRNFINSGVDAAFPIWITEYNLSPDHLDILAAGQHVSGLVFMTQQLQKRLGMRMLLMHNLKGQPNGAFDIDSSNNVSLLETGEAYKQVIKL